MRYHVHGLVSLITPDNHPARFTFTVEADNEETARLRLEALLLNHEYCQVHLHIEEIEIAE